MGTLVPPYHPDPQRGHTQETKKKTISPRLASQGRDFTLSTSLVSQLSQVKHSQNHFVSITLPRISVIHFPSKPFVL